MKKNLLLALLGATSFFAYSQTKGTNAIGLGFSSRQTTNEDPNNGYFNNGKENYSSLTYGRFFKENSRLGITASYRYSESRQNIGYDYTAKGYGAGINYQKYYPLFKKLYAVAGGRGNYFITKAKGHSVHSQAQKTIFIVWVRMVALPIFYLGILPSKQIYYPQI